VAFDPISAVLSIGESLITRLFPDPAQQAQERLKLTQMAQEGDIAKLNAHVQLMLGQIEINKTEASHKSIFVAGWRPACGWVAAIGLAVAFIPKSLFLTFMWVWQCVLIFNATNVEINTLTLPLFPELGISDLIGLLGAMLGVGAMRSFDKAKGTQTDAIKGGK
tara:strand:- start:3117 stop:3608 length:492 start_codon:yes stop_codon:yes gene_type:complete